MTIRVERDVASGRAEPRVREPDCLIYALYQMRQPGSKLGSLAVQSIGSPLEVRTTVIFNNLALLSL